MSVTLPCSGESFTVPSNVYIIGTMNTADRSIALLDTALRRRFDFVEMMPRPELLSNDCEGVDLEKMLKTINERISVLLDREHTIGHAYFMKLDENGESVSIETLDELKRVFKYDIIPLLQEYFFDDYENIQIVLKEKNSSKATDKHTFISKITTSGITDISSYSFNSIDDFTKEDFIRIYNNG
jgi:5-methylcytosine-specific restriction protein B